MHASLELLLQVVSGTTGSTRGLVVFTMGLLRILLGTGKFLKALFNVSVSGMIVSVESDVVKGS